MSSNYLHKKYYKYINVISIAPQGPPDGGTFGGKSASKPRPALRSLIICACSTYRRDNSLSFKQIPPCCCVANNDRSLLEGRYSSARRFLGALIDFCRQAKILITALAVLYRQRRYRNLRVFLFWFVFSFCFMTKRKNEHIYNIIVRYSHNIFYVQNM